PGVQHVVVFDLELVQRSTQRDRWMMTPLACDGRYDLVTVPADGASFRFDARRFTLEVLR
ncbi:MAG TPA: hypothetical protein VIL85_13065, partial [Thermomicrobiales bacterium]